MNGRRPSEDMQKMSLPFQFRCERAPKMPADKENSGGVPCTTGSGCQSARKTSSRSFAIAHCRRADKSEDNTARPLFLRATHDIRFVRHALPMRLSHVDDAFLAFCSVRSLGCAATARQRIGRVCAVSDIVIMGKSRTSPISPSDRFQFCIQG